MEKPSEARKPWLHLGFLARPSTATAGGVAVRIAAGRLEARPQSPPFAWEESCVYIWLHCAYLDLEYSWLHWLLVSLV